MIIYRIYSDGAYIPLRLEQGPVKYSKMTWLQTRWNSDWEAAWPG